jgi:quinol monooxygenase YgiN
MGGASPPLRSPYHAVRYEPSRALRESVVREGRGEELAQLLLAAAADLDGDPGCELYLVNRQVGEPDVIWVTELWRSQDDLDASLEKIRGSDQVASVMQLVGDWEMIELELLGGKGPRG